VRRALPRLATGVVLAGVVAVAGGCGPSAGSSPSASSAVAASPAPATTPGASGAAASPADTLGPPPSLAVDAMLLGVLPAEVGKVVMTPDPENAAHLIGDPTLGIAASGLALARYTAGDDIVVVSVTQLRPGIFSDGFFDSWRQDYDTSACEPAGGWKGVETSQLVGSHLVHLASCTGGATTYQTQLEGDILVSAIAIGPGSLGKDVIAGLRP
jgi:hypothetical protein